MFVYSDHCQEMGKPIPEKPFFFLKPTSSYVRSPDPILIPANTVVDHEGKYNAIQ